MVEKDFNEWCHHGKGTFYVKGQEKNVHHHWMHGLKSGEGKANWYAYHVANARNIELDTPYLFTVPSKNEAVGPMCVGVRDLTETQITALLKRETARYCCSCENVNYSCPNGMWGYNGVLDLALALKAINYQPSMSLASATQDLLLRREHLPNLNDNSAKNDGISLWNGLHQILQLYKEKETGNEM